MHWQTKSHQSPLKNQHIREKAHDLLTFNRKQLLHKIFSTTFGNQEKKNPMAKKMCSDFLNKPDTVIVKSYEVLTGH